MFDIQLVQLIESPVFIQLRMQLIDSNSKHHADLLKTMYGILMILPQSDAFSMLSTRLQACSTLHSHLSLSSATVTSQGTSTTESNNKDTGQRSSTLDLILDSSRKMHIGSSEKNSKSLPSSIVNQTDTVDVVELTKYFVEVHSAYSKSRSEHIQSSPYLSVERSC
jgi:Vacuolar protein 14 C-terminal Fig4p binding